MDEFHEHEHNHDHEHEHHHDHDHEHEHHHDYDHEHEHHHDHEHGHHHHHHADDVFISWGRETPVSYTKDEMESILAALSDEEKYGIVLRSKGVVSSSDGEWIHFDYVPGEPDVRTGSPDIIGKICVIGSKLNEGALAELFRL